ncbi:unnamed protein product [Miscanthus lutarioriparius]|uniref:Uncharacterized protein n=1 Tax=Miscanthus lutarioriparius TaxID=422564 RepID=A0A811RRI6_9POAL|nr:unnamed protein product [Miscanthus lutarioriparius]
MAAWIDIVSIWQPVENVIMVRWIVNGIPRVPWEGNGRFDGTSEYKLDKNGKIYEHKVDNIARNSPTKFKILFTIPVRYRVFDYIVSFLISRISCFFLPDRHS